MTVLSWTVIGALSLMGLSLVVGLAIARVVGKIARDVSDLVDAELWGSAPLTRALEAPGDEPQDVEYWLKQDPRLRRTVR